MSNQTIQLTIEPAYKLYKPNDLRFANEIQYLRLVDHVLEHGEKRDDRTGIGTLSVFAPQPMIFNLRENRFPLLTTKKMSLKNIALELFWFLSGSTNANDLAAQGCHIWDQNGSRSNLDALGLHEYPEGELGAMYGYQWRHFGAPFTPSRSQNPLRDKGFDQITWLIDEIRKNPTSRRLVLTSFNPATLHQAVLPPCHCMAQFYVDTANNMLHCLMFQRSGDLGLGVPYNIASYSLLTILMAHCTELHPGTVTHVMGDAHIYLDHVEALQSQQNRFPFPSPRLRLSQNCPQNIFEIRYEHLDLYEYASHGRVIMQMAL